MIGRTVHQQARTKDGEVMDISLSITEIKFKGTRSFVGFMSADTSNDVGRKRAEKEHGGSNPRMCEVVCRLTTLPRLPTAHMDAAGCKWGCRVVHGLL